MKKIYSIKEYIESNHHFAQEIEILRTIINNTELKETIKWNAPVYTLNGKNVLGLGAFKNHFGIWFFNGVFLTDKNNLLVNAQESKTKALRQMRFTSKKDINEKVVLRYVIETVKNQHLGKALKPKQQTKKVFIPKELQDALDSNLQLTNSFNTLSNGKKREYCNYISEAKKEATKLSRIEKIRPMIKNGLGLNDKYKNC